MRQQSEQARRIGTERPQEAVLGDHPVAFVQASEGVIGDAAIEGLSPAVLSPNATVMVDLKIELIRPIALSELKKQITLLIDGVELRELPALSEIRKANEPDVVAGSSAPFSTVKNNIVRITISAVAPSELPAHEVMLTVYSRLDSRNIAGKMLGAPMRPAINEPESLWPVAALTAALAFGVPTIGFYLYRRRQGQEERRVKQDLLTTVERLQEGIRAREQDLKVQMVRAAELEASVEKSSEKLASRGGPQKIERLRVEPLPLAVPGFLVDAVTRSELTIVLGAGASVSGGLPSGVSLWERVLEAFRDEISPKRIAAIDNALIDARTNSVVELFLATIGREQILEELHRLLQDDRKTSELHRIVGSLGVRSFIDLNWDNLLISSLEAQRPRAFTTSRPDGVAEAMREGGIVVIKPWGRIVESDSVMLTQQDYRRSLARSPEIERCLASLFTTQTLLFIGVTTRTIEETLAGLPPELETSGRQHVALLLAEDDLELWQEGFGRRFGIEIISVSTTEDFAKFAKLLKAGYDQRRHQLRLANDGRLPAAQAHGPGRLYEVKLVNIGNFRSVVISLDESWNLFLGDNGGGKSTILRAIVLALSGNDERCEAMAARLLRTDAQSGEIELLFGSASTTKVWVGLTRDGNRVRIQAPATTPLQAGQRLVLGFPALRGVTTTQPTGPARMSSPEPSVDDVAPLLLEKVDTRLNGLKQWVINVALQEESNPDGREARMFATFKSVVKDIVPGRQVDFNRVDRKTWTVWLSTSDGEVSFDSTSQGTSSILAWVGVLLQRLYDVYPNAVRPEEGIALVIIDEIDAHLHPRWQRKLVALTKSRFPNVQMLASSHSPLLAGAIPRQQLRIVERNSETGEMQVAPPKEDLFGHRADDVLTSSLFDLPTTRSPEAEATIKNYFKLFENPKRTSDQEKRLLELAEEIDHLNYGRPVNIVSGGAVESIDVALKALDTNAIASLSARLTDNSSGN